MKQMELRFKEQFIEPLPKVNRVKNKKTNKQSMKVPMDHSSQRVLIPPNRLGYVPTKNKSL